MNLIKKNWWKALAIILLIYTISFSFLIPLSPGIVRVQNLELIEQGETQNLNQVKTGLNKVIITGYNTLFSSEDEINIGLEFEKKNYVTAKNIRIINPNKLYCELTIPTHLPKKFIHLRLYSNRYSIFAPEIIKTPESNTSSSYTLSENPKIEVTSPLLDIPNRLQLNETIRNLMFHVPMWFTMMTILFISLFYSIKYLSTFDIKYDIIAREAVNIGLLFAVLGLITGSIWAKFTWSEGSSLFSLNGWWVDDEKLKGAAITTLIYLAYLILRNALNEEHQKAKISAVYNIFAFILMLVFIMILPRINDSLHPGNGGNPAFSKYDLDSTLRMVFYPAVLGWILLGVWMLSLKKRISNIKSNLEND